MIRPLLLLSGVLLGHCGWWLFCYNRGSATGLPRRIVKAFEKFCVLCCAVIPIWIAIGEQTELFAWLQSSNQWWPAGAGMFHAWGAWSLASLLVLGAFWLDSRRALFPPDNLLSERSTNFDVEKILEGKAVESRSARLLHRLPGNAIGRLELCEKVIRLPRDIEGFQGLRIGHLSDLHFTGQMSKEYVRFAIEALADLEPDLIALTGDVVDYDRCLNWIDELFADLQARLGCYFLLGNHERRLNDWREVPRRFAQVGWHDLGACPASVILASSRSSTQLLLVGNELPWFDRNPRTVSGAEAAIDGERLLIGLSHSPDQIDWARSAGLDLLLAGHTHGGQIRIPGVGPLVSPSWYGSRFSSGVFFLSPTVMHVSRGLSGVHPLRWNCPPEVSLLTIVSRGR